MIMATCDNCGGHVSDVFARVYADNLGELHACPDCSGQNERLRGAGAGHDR